MLSAVSWVIAVVAVVVLLVAVIAILLIVLHSDRRPEPFRSLSQRKHCFERYAKSWTPDRAIFRNAHRSEPPHRCSLSSAQRALAQITLPQNVVCLARVAPCAAKRSRLRRDTFRYILLTETTPDAGPRSAMPASCRKDRSASWEFPMSVRLLPGGNFHCASHASVGHFSHSPMPSQ